MPVPVRLGKAWKAPAGAKQDAPGRAFSARWMKRRRMSKAVIISATASCGPRRAAMPACWAAAFTQEWQLMARRVAASTSGFGHTAKPSRSEEHTSELQALMHISYSVFCLKKKKKNHSNNIHQ